MPTHEHRVAKALLANRDSDLTFWDWLVPGQPLSRKDANKFLLACILDYQVRAETAWANARRLAEQILADPDDLWGTITSGSLEEWNSRRQEYSLHRFPKGHERVFTIGKRIVGQYGSDVRTIWDNQSIDATLYRLNDLGVGEQISRMVVGALNDVGILRGKGDVKADVHVRRVLGRLLTGTEITADRAQEAVDATRRMHPENPWSLDRPLYRLGKSVCVASQPRCPDCLMKELCAYPQKSR
ncbi:MAG: hypothetical protein RDU83_07245 [bacterium]|nr:hypothetical protein [bacterium]